MRYFSTNVESNNSIVRYIFQSAVREDSRLGNNLRYILHKVNFNVRDIIVNEINHMEICKNIINSWKNSFSENEVKVSEHILELIGRRDSLEP